LSRCHLRLVPQFSKNFRVLVVTQLPEILLVPVSGVESPVGGSHAGAAAEGAADSW
jgi:hypothetical protein